MTTKIKPDSLFLETLSRTLLGLYEPDGVEAMLSALLFRCLVAGRGVLSEHSGCEADPTAPGDRRGTCGGRGRAASASAELGVSGPPLASAGSSGPACVSWPPGRPVAPWCSGQLSSDIRSWCDAAARSSFSCSLHERASPSAGPSGRLGPPPQQPRAVGKTTDRFPPRARRFGNASGSLCSRPRDAARSPFCAWREPRTLPLTPAAPTNSGALAPVSGTSSLRCGRAGSVPGRWPGRSWLSMAALHRSDSGGLRCRPVRRLRSPSPLRPRAASRPPAPAGPLRPPCPRRRQGAPCCLWS